MKHKEHKGTLEIWYHPVSVIELIIVAVKIE